MDEVSSEVVYCLQRLTKVSLDYLISLTVRS